MKKWLYIIILLTAFLAATAEAATYICPMHPTYTSDRPGECAICGMNLVPAEDEAKDIPDRAAIQVTKTQRQVIGVKTAEAKTRTLTREIRTVGTVAYDPKLAVAQKEYLTARRLGDSSLMKAAEERLILMGMSKDQVRKLTRRGRIQKNLYLPGPEGKAWIYSTIYEVDIPYVRVGQAVNIYTLQSPEDLFVGTIAAMDPVVDPVTRTINVRSEVEDSKGLLKPNMYVDTYIRIPLGKMLSVPAAALMWSDKAYFVFVDKGNGKIVPRKVETGDRTKDFIEIKSGLNEGEHVVTSPNFLIDAESQLKATLRSMSVGGEHKNDH
jgi:multidrug efflux pump subunit AcrA (membrane-fusion protein)